MSDLIIANIDELNDYLRKAEHITNRMDDETHHMLLEFRNVPDWDDQIREIVARILGEIELSERKIIEYFEEVYRQISDFSEELDDYISTSRRY